MALSAEFKDHMQTPEIKESVARIETAPGAAHPEISILFVKPQTSKKRRDGRRQREEVGETEAQVS